MKAELRQGCVMSPYLFNLVMGGVLREVTVRTFGKGGQTVGENGEKW